MSTIAAWSYQSPLTIWPVVSEDEFSVPSFGTPYTLLGSWMLGAGTEINDVGDVFSPMSKYHFELPEDDPLIPSRGDYILKGNHVAEADPIAFGAERIEKTGAWDMAMFGANEIPDRVVMT